MAWSHDAKSYLETPDLIILSLLEIKPNLPIRLLFMYFTQYILNLLIASTYT
jgi:hypothetical protein